MSTTLNSVRFGGDRDPQHGRDDGAREWRAQKRARRAAKVTGNVVQHY